MPILDHSLRAGACAPETHRIGSCDIVVSRLSRPEIPNGDQSLAVFHEIVVDAWYSRIVRGVHEGAVGAARSKHGGDGSDDKRNLAVVSVAARGRVRHGESGRASSAACSYRDGAAALVDAGNESMRLRNGCARNSLAAVRSVIRSIDPDSVVDAHRQTRRRGKDDVGGNYCDVYPARASVAAYGGVGNGETGCACGIACGYVIDAAVAGVDGDLGVDRSRVAAGNRVAALIMSVAARVDPDSAACAHSQSGYALIDENRPGADRDWNGACLLDSAGGGVEHRQCSRSLRGASPYPEVAAIGGYRSDASVPRVLVEAALDRIVAVCGVTGDINCFGAARPYRDAGRWSSEHEVGSRSDSNRESNTASADRRS